MSKILVTGATGFVGDAVVKALIRAEHHLITTSSSMTSAKSKPWFGKVTHIPFDLKDFDSETNYYQFFESPDIVIHLAWEGLPNYLKDFHLTENLPRHTGFLVNMVENGLNNLTVTGTCLEYGMIEGKLSEQMDNEPSNPYAKAKNELRLSLESLTKSTSLNFKWLRLFYMYGPGQGPNSIIPQLENALEKGDDVFNMSGGQQTRDFLHIDLVAECVVKCALQTKITGIINCASGIPVTVENFIRNYLKSSNKNIQLNLGFYPYTVYEPMHFWGDITKLKLL